MHIWRLVSFKLVGKPNLTQFFSHHHPLQQSFWHRSSIFFSEDWFKELIQHHCNILLSLFDNSHLAPEHFYCKFKLKNGGGGNLMHEKTFVNTPGLSRWHFLHFLWWKYLLGLADKCSAHTREAPVYVLYEGNELHITIYICCFATYIKLQNPSYSTFNKCHVISNILALRSENKYGKSQIFLLFLIAVFAIWTD